MEQYLVIYLKVKDNTANEKNALYANTAPAAICTVLKRGNKALAAGS